jgi:hypothetical protein
MLRDLQDWGWQVKRYNRNHEEYVKALEQIDKDIKRRRRCTYALAGRVHGYQERPTLDEVWEAEGRKKYEESMWEVDNGEDHSVVSEVACDVPDKKAFTRHSMLDELDRKVAEVEKYVRVDGW